MDETDRPDDRRADGSWVLPNSESRRQRNHEAAKSKNSKRKKTRTYPPLSCKIEYLLASNHSDRSIASEFFTGDESDSLRIEQRLFGQAPSLTESEKASDSKGRGRGPVRISYRLRFRHRQRGLIWISGHQTAVNRDFRLLSRDL